MSKSNFKGSLLATTVIAGVTLASPAFAQNPPQPPAPVTPTDTQGTTPPAAPSDQTPPAGVQSNESAKPAEPTSSNEIVITGTLIRNPNLVAAAPVTVVGHEEMQLRQTNTAEQILRTIPGVAPSIGQQVNNGSGGSAYVNLRGIGSNRNIVLLDGVRIVPADLVGRVDLNNIPLALVDRVDVLTGGASSTYGADAVGGVVNFITRSDFSGMELSVGDQITQRGDGNYIRGDLTLGANFDDGRGNAVISIGYQEADPVYQGGDRPWSNLALASSSPGFLPAAGSSRTVPAAFDIGGGRPRQQVSPDGVGIQNFYLPFNFNPYNVFQTPFKRYNLFSAGHYDITDHLTVYARGLFSDNTVDTIIAPSGVFDSLVTVPFSNPFLSAAQRNYFCANALVNLPGGTQQRGITAAECAAAAVATNPADPAFRSFQVGLRRRMPELGPRISDYRSKVWDFRAGVRGDITDKIGFDVFVARGNSDKTQRIQNYALTSHVRQALWATNATTCLSTSPPAAAGASSSAPGCVPLNIFGTLGSITPAMGDFISEEASTVQAVSLSQARGTINGDLPLQLWARNPVSFAVGGEYRKYGAEQRADSLAKTPGELGGAGGAAPDTKGGFDVYEGYAEIVAPIVSDRPFAEELQLEAGIRRSHYTVNSEPVVQLLPIGAVPSTGYNTTTWKIAGSWAPVHDIKFRGSYNRAVRAPNISELFAPKVVGLTNLAQDPCQGGLPLANPNLAAICIAQGAPASQLGFITPPTAGQANGTFSGSLALGPEKANTWTVGAVMRPRFLPGFSATIDYYNIKIKNAISAPTPNDVINACFGNVTAASATSPACLAIQRDPNTGQLDGDPAIVGGLSFPLTNLGKIATDGVDFTFDYRRGIGTILNTPAKLALAFGGNWTHSNKFQAINITTPQFPTQSVNRECVGFYSANCNPAPKWSFNERTTLSLGRVDLSLLWRYIGKVKYEPLEAANSGALFSGTIASFPCPSNALCSLPGTLNGEEHDFNNIHARNYFDFTTRFNVNEHFDLTFTIMNLFDNKPPIVGNTAGTTTFNSGNTFPATYDPLGRRFAAGARIKF
jgi:outer membrane receptor protein involved in Fe transport